MMIIGCRSSAATVLATECVAEIAEMAAHGRNGKVHASGDAKAHKQSLALTLEATGNSSRNTRR